MVGVVTGAGLRRVGGRTGVGPVMIRGAWGVASGKAAVAARYRKYAHAHTRQHTNANKAHTRTIDREEEEKTNRAFNSRNRGIVHIYSGLL